MNITLKNIKYSAFASEETHCFQASVYIDGKKAGLVSNAGHGGSNSYQSNDLYQRLDDYAKTLPKHKCDFKDAKGNDVYLDINPDFLISDLLNDYLVEQDFKKTISKRLLYTVKGSEFLYQSNVVSKDQMQRYMANQQEVKSKLDAEQVLNFMDAAQALEIFKKRAG